MKRITQAIAVTGIILAGMAGGVANATTPGQSAQCARATLVVPAFCNGGSSAYGTESGDSTGRVAWTDKGSYYSGNGPDKVIGQRPVLDSSGNPVLDDEGNPTFESITVPGDPIFAPRGNTAPGERDSDGNIVVDLRGYQYK